MISMILALPCHFPSTCMLYKEAPDVPADIGQGSQSGSRVSVLMFFVSSKPTVH
jgi:hypothetical protein